MQVRNEVLYESGGGILLQLKEYFLPATQDLMLQDDSANEGVLLILEGEGQCEEDTAVEKDLFLLPRGGRYGVRLHAKTDMRAVIFRFSLSILQLCDGEPADPRLFSALYRSAGPACKISQTNKQREESFDILLKLWEEMATRPTYFEMMVKALLLQLITQLLRAAGESAEPLPRLGAGAISGLERATRYMDENFTEELTLDGICAAAGMGKSWFLRLFKQLNGVSPWEYVTLRRVSHSAQLLKETNMSVLEAAMRSGFNSKSGYNRAFQRVMQTTPTEYRAAVRRSERYGIGMLEKYHLAIDIGASSGRLILGGLEHGRIVTEEIYRFENHMVKRNGRLCWDYDYLFSHILQGLRQCKSLGKVPLTLGIDTWGVDYVLLDGNDRVIGETYAYRDPRVGESASKVFALIPEAELYRRTGIQFEPFNTIFQLFSRQQEAPDELRQARSFLMAPEYLAFLLTGVKKNEYTIATTTGMINLSTGSWDTDILELFHCPTEVFGPLCMPGTQVGMLSPDVERQVGFQCRVIFPPSHDTASSVLAVPMTGDDALYISSGTWSLMGVESPVPYSSEESRRCKLTNEGGYGGRYRYLRNIMGLWMIQSVRRELGNKYGFSQLSDMAKKASFSSVVDVNDSCFLAPDSMIDAVKNYCAATCQPVPQTNGELMRCIYLSLAESYKDAAKRIAEITGRKFSRIHVVGGGSRDEYLNELTAKTCGIPVLAGPVECTALGNLASQMIAQGKLADLADARKTIAQSFQLKEFK